MREQTSWEIWVENKDIIIRIDSLATLWSTPTGFELCRQLGATSSIPFSQALSGSDDMLLTGRLRK